jgi:flagellar biosynthetic protein FliS
MFGIASYRSSRVASAPPAQIVMMLFEEAIKRLTLASVCRTEGEEVACRGHLQHVRQIVLELRVALDPEPSPVLHARLSGLYVWVQQELVAAARDTNDKRILTCQGVFEQLATGWRAALRQVAP